jgi:hypothetical protein
MRPWIPRRLVMDRSIWFAVDLILVAVTSRCVVFGCKSIK